MKIRYTEFALNPALRGTTTHLPAHRAQALLDTGAAVEVPRAPRGTPEWQAEMKELEALRVASIPADQRQTALSTTPTWTLRYTESARKYVVAKSSLAGEFIYGETILLDKGRPDFKASEKHFVWFLKQAGCPEAIIQRWQAARNAPDVLAAEAARLAEDKRLAEAQRERERNAPRFI